MRLPAAAMTTAVAGVSVLAAWHTGAGRTSGGGAALAGVSVAAPAPDSTSADRGTSTARHSSKSRIQRTRAGKTTAKPPVAPVQRSVTGGVASTPFGNVQVRILVVGKRIRDIKAVHLTDSGNHSVQLSAHAAPILRREALAAQSATIDTVSGASYTSEGYRQSLQSALDAAHL